MADLEGRIAESSKNSNEGIQALNEMVNKLGSKLDGHLQKTAEAIARLDSKVDSGAQLTSEVSRKIDSKLDGDIKTVNEEIGKLGDRLEANVQTTNQAIGDLYREKLSVREFREFVNDFHKILSEGLLLPKEPVAEASLTAPLKEDAPNSPATQISAIFTPQIVREPTSIKANEEKPLVVDAIVGDTIGKHVGSPMKVAGESYYVGGGVRAIVGDVEIPPGTTVNETLVVKGNFRSCQSCKLLNDVKALKTIEIGSDTLVEGALVGGGKVIVHSNCFVKGSIESEGNVEIGDNVFVTENISSKSSVILSKTAQTFRPIHAAKGVLRL